MVETYIQDMMLYPVVNRTKKVGTAVYEKLESTQDVDIDGDIFCSAVPYMEDIKESIKSYGQNWNKNNKIIIVSKDKNIALKVARFYENFRKADLIEEKLNRDEFSEMFRDAMEINVDENELYEVNLSTISEKDKDGLNPYLRIVGEVSTDVGVVFTGLERVDDTDSKIQAILTKTKGSVYIWITEDHINSKYVNDLRIDNNFEMMVIRDIPLSYYEDILMTRVNENGYSIDKNITVNQIIKHFKALRDDRFCEEELDWLVCNAIKNCRSRDNSTKSLTEADFSINSRMESTVLEKLNEMPGLKNPKDKFIEISAMAHEIAINSRLNDMHRSFIACGNPGTGKTEFGNLLVKYLAEQGISNGNFVIATRSDIIGEFVGKTAVKVAKKFEEAKGGMLFVDEAGFFLNRTSGGYVEEALKEFVRYMEIYPDVMVVFAMYEREAEQFLKLDEGLSSRISDIVKFEDYTDNELIDIASYMFSKRGYKWQSSKSQELIKEYLLKIRNNKNFGNAREIRKLVESAICKHAVKIMEAGKEFDPVITTSEIESAIKSILIMPKENNKKKMGFQV